MINYRTRLTGQKFGKLTVLRFSFLAKGNKSVWLCKCECGQEKSIRNDCLIKGTTQSCGCLNRKIGNESKGWKGYGEIYGGYWSRIQTEAKARNLEFSISIEEAWNLYLKQNRLCSLTGDKIDFGNASNRTASFDRIDSRKGYVSGNVQWVTKEANFAKQALSQEEFLNLCKKVVKHATVA